jgi:serine/threonine protein kinase
MSAPATIDEFLSVLGRTSLVEEKAIRDYVAGLRLAGQLPPEPKDLAQFMVRDGLLTHFQAQQVVLGKTRGYTISGKYKLLEHLGEGGMGSVYLCEHISMRRRVAIKVLPLSKAQDSSYLERFYREARAVAALDHPNIVRAHDIDHDGKLHFLVMEYVDGSSLQQIVKKSGPMDAIRACHYIAQAAVGLQAAHEAGLVHRDVKPGNILVDRNGVVKVLDMGLARFFNDDDNLSKKYEETVLGTTDYLAPEQAVDSSVDIRADVYSLGATFYFLLTGRTLFGEGLAAQKLIWQQTRHPKLIRSFRPDVPADLADLIHRRMLAKDREQRFQVPAEAAEALAPWLQTPIPPPPAEEMPHLCPAALRGDGHDGTVPRTPSPLPRTGWSVASHSHSPSPQGPHALQSRSSMGTLTPKRLAPVAPASTVRRSSAPGNGSARAHAGNSESPTSATSIQEAPREPLPPAPAQGRPRTLAFIHHHQAVNWMAAAVALVVVAGTLWWAGAGSRGVNSGSPPREPVIAGSPAGVPPGEGKDRPGQAQPPATAVTPPAAADVAIHAARGVRRVHTPQYDAVVEADGCLTSLRVGGTELLRPGLNISRGTYLHQEEGALALTAIEQPAANAIAARSDRGSIRYEFGKDSILFTAANATDRPMNFFLVFSAAVEVAADERGEWARVPARQEWPTVAFYAEQAKLTISGGNRIWPWFENSQVYHASLTPRESRQVVLRVAAPTAGEQSRAAAVSGRHRVHQAGYEALVEADGCLTSLRVGGTELLWVGGSISRGCYFFQDKAGRLPLPTVERPSANGVSARSEAAAVRYEFGPDEMTWTLTNTSKGPLIYFIVFGEAVKAVCNDKGEWAAAPATREWPVTNWFAGSSRLAITGGNKMWGPFEENTQVWEADLAPGEQRQVVLKIGPASRSEAAHVAQVSGGTPVVDADLMVQSPKDYQVFQRYSRLRGQALLQGRVKPFCTRLEARLSGTSLSGPLPDKWQDVDFNSDNRSFDTTLPLPAGGWYKLELRALRDKDVVASVVIEHVGVGEVFVAAGQSNATNCGEQRLKVQSGLVSTFDGSRWRIADDPQPGVHDKTGGGSCWPPFGDALYGKYHVPVGIASTGHSGSSVAQWQKGGPYYQWLAKRIEQLGPGGFRGVLWHQGETDVRMSPEEYARLLQNLIEGTKKDAGWDFPWFVAQVSYLNPREPSFPTTRAAQKKLWEAKAALEGPDTDALTGDNRDDGGKGIHFSAKGLQAHGKLWADRVAAYLDKVLEAH